MGPAADELAVHARPDDRHSGSDMTVGTTIANLGMTDVKFPHPLFEGDTVHCTTEVSASANRSRGPAPASSIPPPRLQPGRQAGRRVQAPGLHAHAAAALPALRIRVIYQPQLPQRGRTGTTTVRAGATIWVRCTVAYCGGISSYCTPSGATMTVFGTITVS
jgi:hypothetical protein